MNLSIEKEELLFQLQSAVRVASSRTTVQSLTGVQLTAGSDGVELAATDMEVGVRLPLQASVAAGGTVVLPARLLFDVVRSLPAKELTLALRESEADVELKSGSATFHLRTLRADDFPAIPQPATDAAVSLSAAKFVTTAEQVVRSASRDETRPILTGVYVSATGSQLRMVATDSYRLSVQETSLEIPVSEQLEANVPARALQELARLVGEGEGDLNVALDGKQIVFTFGGAVLSSRLIDGQFPNYQQLLPDAYDHELNFKTEQLVDVVRRISLLAQKNTPLRLSLAAGKLIISAQTPDIGEATEALESDFSGEEFEIGFNPEFLRDGLESITAEEVVLKLISPLRPGLIEPADDSGFLYLIMPIRLNT